MVSDAAFEHSRELISSMSLTQAQQLQMEVEARIARYFIASKVFGTAELLEIILSNLEFFDIFRVMGVSRVFRDTVIGSNRLRGKQWMHLQPTNPPGDALDALNPFLDEVLAPLGFTLVSRIRRVYGEASDKYSASDRYELLWEISHNKLHELAPPNKLRQHGGRGGRHFIGDRKAKKGAWATTFVVAAPARRLEVCFSTASSSQPKTFRQLHTTYNLLVKYTTLEVLYDLAIAALEGMNEGWI